MTQTEHGPLIMKDSVTTKKRYHESYYIIQGKIVTWNQFDMDIKEE